MSERELLLERLERLAIVLDEIMPRCAGLVRDAIALLKERPGKGHWIEYPECLEYDGAIDDTYIACSECGHVFCIMDNCTEEFDFCPHCGARMTEGR